MTQKQLVQIKNHCLGKMALSQDPQHDIGHVQRVTQNALKITDLLNLKSKLDLNLLQVICYLHDIHYSNLTPSLKAHLTEGKILQQTLPQVIKQFNLSSKDQEIILNAIYNSPHSFPFKKLNPHGSYYLKILQDADTIDYFSNERLISLKQAKKKFFFYRLVSLFSNPVLRFGLKNLKDYLNYPHLVPNFY